MAAGRHPERVRRAVVVRPIDDRVCALGDGGGHSEFAVSEHRRARGALPDYPVTSTIHYMLRRRDAALERAIAVLSLR